MRVAANAAAAVRAQDGKVIWQTTTAGQDRQRSRWHDAKALIMAEMYNFNVFDTWAITEKLVAVPGAYWDSNHLNDFVIREINNLLLNAIC